MKNKEKAYTRDEKGFTLVEVLVSIVIISLILLGVVNLFAFTNKTAKSNNTKLVSTHLAKATIERIEMQPESFFPLDQVNSTEKEYRISDCQSEACKKLYEFKVNDLVYDVMIKVRQDDEEEKLGLINVVVEIGQGQSNLKSIVEGYLIDETTYE